MGAKSSKEGDRELSPVTKIRGKAERAVATAARGGYSSGSSSSVNSSMNQSKNSRTGPTSSKWPRQTPPPSDAWGQKTQKSSKPPQSNRLIEEEENEDDPFRGKEIHSGLTVTDLPLVSSRNDPSGGSRNRDTSPPKPAKPKKRNSDPFAHFKNVTELRDIKDAKENKPPPPEPSRPPWRKPATPPPQPYLKKGGARGTTHPTENSSDKESKGPPVRNKKSLPKKGGGGGGAKKQSSFSPEKKNSASDVSTLEMDADPSPEHFKKIESAPKFSRSLNVPKKGSEDESDTKGSRPQRSKSSSPPSTRKRKEKKGTNRRPRPLKSSFSFSNIASAKSTTQSLDSASSNFEHRTKVEKFRDKMDSLADAGLAHKNPHLNNQFHDQKIIGLQSYEKAKSDCGSDDWEREIKGIEMIVSISRDKPEVSTRPTFSQLQSPKSVDRTFLCA